MHDNNAEGTENLIVELRSNDSAVVVPTGGDIVIVNIMDMPNPFGKQWGKAQYRAATWNLAYNGSYAPASLTMLKNYYASINYSIKAWIATTHAL